VGINVLWLQRLWPLLRQSGPLITRLADAYVKRGADKKTAETLAETAVILDQILDERLRGLAQAEEVETLRQEIQALRQELARLGPRRRNPYLIILVLGQLLTLVFVILLWTHLP
jgi:hypothetical protein